MAVARSRLDQARVLAFGGGGLLMLLSVLLIAMQRLGWPVPAELIAMPAILAQLAALAGLLSLYVITRRSHTLLARTGLGAALISVAVIMVAAAWLVLAGAERPPAGIQVLAVAFIVFEIVAFLANSGALLRSGRTGRSIALCFLLPPLLWGGMIGVALVRGIEAALRLDLFTNAGAGVALIFAAVLLRRGPSLEN